MPTDVKGFCNMTLGPFDTEPKVFGHLGIGFCSRVHVEPWPIMAPVTKKTAEQLSLSPYFGPSLSRVQILPKYPKFHCGPCLGDASAQGCGMPVMPQNMMPWKMMPRKEISPYYVPT